MPRYADLDVDTINHVVEEAGKFCEDKLLPINRSGEVTDIKPREAPGEPPLKWNWDSPLIRKAS